MGTCMPAAKYCHTERSKSNWDFIKCLNNIEVSSIQGIQGPVLNDVPLGFTQWNPSNVDIFWGPGKVFCIERYLHFRLRKRTTNSALNTEVSSFQECPLRGVPLYSVLGLVY